MEAYYPSQHTMSPAFPLRQAPTCSVRTCTKTAIPDRANAGKRSQNAGRPYYYCDAGHKRQFVTWNDMVGISNTNPRCWCRHHSRRNEDNGPVPSAWYDCATRRCSFKQNIHADEAVESIRSSPSSGKSRSGSSTVAGPQYYGCDLQTTTAKNDAELLDRIKEMTAKIEQLETTISTKPPTV
ncbi:hypothetical protein FBEOM_13228, partial [Fusarium beomiforme]